MANLQALKAELDSDPLTRGYAAMTDGQAADSLTNTVDRTSNKASMTSSEVLNSVVLSELDAKSASKQAEFWNLMSIGTLDPFGIEASIMTGIFGASSTITALQAARKNPDVSRAAEIGLGMVGEGHVAQARAI